jgi:UDP-sugar transporter A1/2/3
MLRRSLSSTKWFALILLTIGVAVVQLPTSDSSSYDPVTDDDLRWSFPRSVHELGQLANGAAEVAAELTKRGIAQLAEGLMRRSATYEGIQDDLGLGKPVMNPTLGTTCVIIAAIISGLTGVYFEKVLKDSSSSVSVWTRNVQLSFYSLFPALFIGVWFKDGEEIGKYGFWTGYNATVWTAIAFQALGGMLVALVIRDADNIAKNFATSISIILSLGFSVWVFDFEVTGNVSGGPILRPLVGAVLIC